MRRDIPQGVTVSTSFFQVGLFSHLPPLLHPPVWIRLVQEGKANLLFTSVCSHNGATCSPRVVIHGSTETQRKLQTGCQPQKSYTWNMRQCVNTYRRSCTVYSFGRGLHRTSIYRISVDKIDEILFSISLEIFVLGFLWNFLTVCRSFLLTYFFFFFFFQMEKKFLKSESENHGMEKIEEMNVFEKIFISRTKEDRLLLRKI